MPPTQDPQPAIDAPDAAGEPLDWQEMRVLPAFGQFFLLIRRLFGLNLGLLSPDGGSIGLIDPGGEINPFCRAIQQREGGRARCFACDAEHARLVARSGRSLRYACHAGLTEFIIPVRAGERVVALLQCGQVLARAPRREDWRATAERLRWLAGGTAGLSRAFRRIRVLPEATQKDLVALLELIAHNIATVHLQSRLLGRAPRDQVILRALAHMRERFRQPLTIAAVARAASTSPRHLTRLMQRQAGGSFLQVLHGLRVAHARGLLGDPRQKMIDVALASGFGSVQQFNRVFRGSTGLTPSAWRLRLRAGVGG